VGAAGPQWAGAGARLDAICGVERVREGDADRLVLLGVGGRLLERDLHVNHLIVVQEVRGCCLLLPDVLEQRAHRLCQLVALPARELARHAVLLQMSARVCTGA
jgi:hypothetical protein